MAELTIQGSSPDLDIRVKDEPVDLDSITPMQHDFELNGISQSTENINNPDSDIIIEPSDQLASPVPDAGRPLKRQRIVMDSVLLPTLAEVQRKKGASDDDFQKLKKLFKPKKKTEMILSDEILASRLKPIGLDTFPVNLPRAELNQMVSRSFMSSVYGGSAQATHPQISAQNLAKHGLDDFMYLHLKYHPYAPQCPGGNGLWFSPEQGRKPWEGVHRVFTRDKKLTMWQYMGQYHVKTTASLTLDEWLGLKLHIRNSWAREIQAKHWGSGVCSRIQARKELGPGKEPTEKEQAAVRKSGRWKRTTQEDVRMAFDCGKEKMGVWTVKCIGYDYPFQLELYNKYPNWTPPENSEPKKKGKRSKGIKKDNKGKIKFDPEDLSIRSTKAPADKKRKRAQTVDSESSSESESAVWTNGGRDKTPDISDEEEAVLMKIRTRGTKSRPICL